MSPQDLKCAPESSVALYCTWSPPVTVDHEVQGYTLSYKLFDGFDYYPNYGTTLGVILLQSETMEYFINGLVPYGGYVIEVIANLFPIVGSGFSGEESLIPLNNFTTGSATVLNLTHPEGTLYLLHL